MNAPALDFAAIKGVQRSTWNTGDYGKIANAFPLMGELLCEAVDLRAGSTVLDVATGSGNTAIAAARRQCHVTGLDYVEALLDRARTRAEAEQVDVTFEQGDAEQLPYDDGAFDYVLSTIGVMFAPDQPKAAAELLRVCRPGGVIGLACWTPDGFVGEFFGVHGRYAPPPAGLASPLRWGTEDGLAGLLGDGVTGFDVTRRNQVFRYPSVTEYVTHYLEYFGPTATAAGALSMSERDAFAADLRALITRHNTADDGTVVVPAEYLEVVATRR